MKSHIRAGKPGTRFSPGRWIGFVLVCALAGGLAYLKWHPRAEALLSSQGAGSATKPLDVVRPLPRARPDGMSWQPAQDQQRRAVEAVKAATASDRPASR